MGKVFKKNKEVLQDCEALSPAMHLLEPCYLRIKFWLF